MNNSMSTSLSLTGNTEVKAGTTLYRLITRNIFGQFVIIKVTTKRDLPAKFGVHPMTHETIYRVGPKFEVVLFNERFDPAAYKMPNGSDLFLVEVDL